MQGLPFTGCGSVGLTLCKHKGISKKILSYHRIHVPEFAIIPRGKRIARPKRLKFPILIKPLKEEASLGISQASFVETDEQFNERVQFIHTKHDNDVIAEEYIEGRELYVSIVGNHRLQVFPVRELVFKEVQPDEPKIATYKAKWDKGPALVWYVIWDDARSAERFMRSAVALRNTARPGYRAAIDSLTVGGRPATRYVLAPEKWGRWRALPEVR